MKIARGVSLVFLAIITMVSLPPVYAEQTVSIVMEKTVYEYCEKLFYTIQVSEVTGDSAIIHIRDESGGQSSAIPIPITGLQTPVPSVVAFEAEIFPLGKYFIDVEYSGAKSSAEFELVESNASCIPQVMKTITANWLSGKISDGFLLDAFKKYVDDELIDIPLEITRDNVYKLDIPEWVKNLGYWWLTEEITEDAFVEAINYMIKNNIIGFPMDVGNET